MAVADLEGTPSMTDPTMLLLSPLTTNSAGSTAKPGRMPNSVLTAKKRLWSPSTQVEPVPRLRWWTLSNALLRVVIPRRSMPQPRQLITTSCTRQRSRVRPGVAVTALAFSALMHRFSTPAPVTVVAPSAE
jgi:hypothetical protein